MRILYIIICILFLSCDEEKETYGCTDASACNFNPNATIFDGSCEYANEMYDCEGNCIGNNYNCSIIGNWVLKQVAQTNFSTGGVVGEEEDLTIEDCIELYNGNQFIKYYSSSSHYNGYGCLGNPDDEICEFTVDDDLYVSDYFLKALADEYENLNICNLTSNTFDLCESCIDCSEPVLNVSYQVDDIFLEMIISDNSEQINSHCRHEIYVVDEQSDFIEFGCIDTESCDYESTATHQLYGNSCAYIGDYDLCEGVCSDIFWADEIGYNSERDYQIGGYTPDDFAWYNTEGIGEYIGEIYVPNFEYFCTQDQANCYTATHELITEANYDISTISYIDLPHDNLGLAPLEFYEDPYFLANDIMTNWGDVLFGSGCYTSDPMIDGMYINDFNQTDCETGNFYDFSQGINVDDYDFQYLSTGDIQIAISDGNFDNVNIFNCNAVSVDGIPFDGAGVFFNDANIPNNFNEIPCNADVIYMGEYIYNVDEEYGKYNPFGDLEINSCGIPFPE